MHNRACRLADGCADDVRYPPTQATAAGLRTSNATRMGTLAALCMGVAEAAIAESTRQPGLVGRYKSERGISICAHISASSEL